MKLEKVAEIKKTTSKMVAIKRYKQFVWLDAFQNISSGLFIFFFSAYPFILVTSLSMRTSWRSIKSIKSFCWCCHPQSGKRNRDPKAGTLLTPPILRVMESRQKKSRRTERERRFLQTASVCWQLYKLSKWPLFKIRVQSINSINTVLIIDCLVFFKTNVLKHI